MAKSRDNRNCADHTRQTAIRLFDDCDREQRDIAVEVERTTPRNGARERSLLSSCTPQLFITSPAARRLTPVPPNAPIKLRKPFSKEGLKPKKLRFTDKEKDEAEDENYSQKSVDFSTKISKQKVEFSKERGKSKERLDRESLSTLLQNIKLELDNKENRRYRQERYEKRAKKNRSVAKEHDARNNNDSSQSSKLNCSPKDFKNCPIVLSPCNDTWSKEKKLLWLQPRRDVGMWIQCCRKSCKKWRYCDDFHDPVNVPKIWYCKMNSDKTIASCFIPEVPNTKEIEEDLIENKYNAGSLVWGRMDNYPWWPAIVDDCPETLRYYELQESSIIPVRYHVTFFKNNLQCTWLNLKNIKSFKIKSKKIPLLRKQNKFDEINCKKSLEEAYALAQSAIPLSIYERLQKFSCISRLKNFQGLSQPCEEQDDEIPSTPTKSTKHITLKEFYFKNKCYTKDNKFL